MTREVASERKGQSMQLLMFALILVGLAVGIMTFTTIVAAPHIFGDTMSDVPVISEAQARTGDTAEYYVPLSAHYSMAQGVWEVGQANDYLIGINDLEGHYETEVDDVQYRAQSVFDTYIQDMAFQRCSVEVPDKDVEVGINSTTVNVTNENYGDPFVRTECPTPGLEVVTTDGRDEVERNTSNIRFHHLMVMTINALEAVYDDSESAKSDDDYYGTVTEQSACYLDYEEAREEATEESEAAAGQEILDLQSRFEQTADDTVDNLEITGNGNTGIFGRIIDFVTFWSSDDGFGWDFNIYYNSTDIEEQSNTLSNCACQEWGCVGYLNSDTYDYDTGSNQCEHEDEPFGEPNCDGLTGVEHDGYGECETSYHPDKCGFGYTYNSTSQECDENGGTNTEPACDYQDYSLDTIGADECVHDNAGSDATCDSDAAIEQGGDCVHDGSRPDRTCIERPKKAESETYYELERYTMQSEVADNKYEIPVENGWHNLEIRRRFHYDFPEP